MAHMEDVLDLYAEPYNPQRPVVCFDETSAQLLAATCSWPENSRRAWRHLEVTERRAKEDFAYQMRWLVDEAYPEARVVRVVLDNLNTHRKASLYQTFPAAEALRIAKRLEFNQTPMHGSWLSMAEIEFSVISRSCLRQRLPDHETLCRGIHALERERNEARAVINWRFRIQDARSKHHRLYPTIPSVTGY